MKRLIPTTPILLLTILAGCQPSSSSQKASWEYQTVDLSDTMYQAKGVDKELNRLGAEGWEVVAFSTDPRNPTNEWKFVLKRVKK